MKLTDRLKLFGVALGANPRGAVVEDRFQLVPDSDGFIREPCWFCNEQIELAVLDALAGEGIAVVVVDALGTDQRIHGVCHWDCAERAKGSLAF